MASRICLIEGLGGHREAPFGFLSGSRIGPDRPKASFGLAHDKTPASGSETGASVVVDVRWPVSAVSRQAIASASSSAASSGVTSSSCRPAPSALNGRQLLGREPRGWRREQPRHVAGQRGLLCRLHLPGGVTHAELAKEAEHVRLGHPRAGNSPRSAASGSRMSGSARAASVCTKPSRAPGLSLSTRPGEIMAPRHQAMILPFIAGSSAPKGGEALTVRKAVVEPGKVEATMMRLDRLQRGGVPRLGPAMAALRRTTLQRDVRQRHSVGKHRAGDREQQRVGGELLSDRAAPPRPHRRARRRDPRPGFGRARKTFFGGSLSSPLAGAASGLSSGRISPACTSGPWDEKVTITPARAVEAGS